MVALVSEGVAKPLDQCTDTEVAQQISCFGVSFSKGEPGCMSVCEVRDRCVTRIAKVYVPQLLTERQTQDFDLPSLAAALETDTDTAAVVQAVRMGKPVAQLLPSNAPPPPLPKDPPPEAPVAAAAAAASPPAPVARRRKAPPQDAPAEKAPEASKNPVTKKSKKAGNAVVPESVESGKPDIAASAAPLAPVPEESMKPVDMKKTTRSSSRSTAPAKVAGNAAVTAYQRERLKSPFVAGLHQGQTLTREYDGKKVTLEVDAQHCCYVLNGKKWPTVYAATASVTGLKEFPKQKQDDGKRPRGTRAMSAWSAKRFWGTALAAPGTKMPAAKKDVAGQKAAKKGKKILGQKTRGKSAKASQTRPSPSRGKKTKR